MKWNKLGKVFDVNLLAKGKSHAQVPTVLVLEDRLRVYFSFRPKPDLSLTSIVDLDRDDPTQILDIHPEPILQLGQPGDFDEHGIMPSCVRIHPSGEIWLFYCGWSRRESIPYSNWTGIAVSRDGGITFKRKFKGPVLDRTPNEVYSATAPFIIERNGQLHCWYACGIDWRIINGKHEEFYTIRKATSPVNDGVNWTREEHNIFSYDSNDPTPMHRPTIIEYKDIYVMLFCYRKTTDFRDGCNAYRIGAALSNDLKKWKRHDEFAGLKPSADDWDSNMMAYPQLVTYEKRTLLFYNGNSFGLQGFGIAELVS
jgi:predicted GH43/DUF377 family glycosyl hydrolase